MNSTYKIALAAVTLLAAATAEGQVRPNSLVTLSNNLPATLLARAAESDTPSLDFGYCYTPIDANVINQGEVQKYAIYVPEETVRQYAGATVEAAVIANGCIPNEEFSAFKIGLYKTLDDDAEPLVSMNANMGIRNHFEWKAYEFPETYVVKPDEPFYLIMEFPVKYYPRNQEDLEDNFMPCAVDWALVPDDRGYSDLIYSVDTDSDNYSWWNVGPLTGNNCMRLRLTGDMIPTNDLGASDLRVPARLEPGKEFTSTIILTNYGANPVASCTYTVQIADEAPVEHFIEFVDSKGEPMPLAYHESYATAFEATTQVIGPAVPIKLTITESNGTTDGYAANNEVSTTTLSISDENGFQRGLYIEEGTGTWCGWCPMGIVAFEQMRQLYPDLFAGVAIHFSNDPMTPKDGSFDEAIASFGGNAPIMSVNLDRDRTRMPSPTTNNMMTAMGAYTADPAYVKASINVKSLTKTELELETEYTFAGPAENIYSVFYVVSEDNVGPYPQTNSYSSGIRGELDGWEKMPGIVSTIYNDVARTMFKVDDTSAFIPAQIEGDTPYVDARKISFSDQVVINDPDNCNVIAVIVNKNTGLVENASIKRCVNFNTNSITDVNAENGDAPVEFFDLNGRKVNPDNSPAGIYIRRQGNQVTKQAIR